MKTRMLAVLLTLCMVLSLVSVGALADDAPTSGTCGENAEWNFDMTDGTLTISGIGAMEDYASGTDSPWYALREQIQSIVIEDGITTIGDFAFSECGSAAEVSIGISSELKTIGKGAFNLCASLTEITIPFVKEVKEGAFYGCKKLTSATFRSISTTIADTAFAGCKDLVIYGYDPYVSSSKPQHFAYDHGFEFRLLLGMGELCDGVLWKHTEDGLLRIYGTGAIPDFDDNKNKAPWPSTIETVQIEQGITAIGAFAFYQCNGWTVYGDKGGLVTATVADSVTSIGKCAFSGCTDLKRIKLPKGRITIGEQAFYSCTNLVDSGSLEMVSYIGANAFNSCKQLKKAVLSDVEIEAGAFAYCLKLASVEVLGNSSIGDTAFYECSDLTKVTLADSVTALGGGAFYGCTGLTDIVIPGSVAAIGEDAFKNDTGLETVEILDGVQSIGDSAFFGCKGLTEIIIPTSVTEIGVWMLGDCSSDVKIFGHTGTTAEAYAEANEHHFCGIHYKGDDAVTVLPTCAVSGSCTYTCTFCQEKQVETIDPLPHSSALQHVKSPTCLENGYTGDQVCTVCGKTIKTGVEISALGHRWNDGVVTKAPTIREVGVRTYICTVCGVNRTEEIPAIPAADFADVGESEYYAIPVSWAVSKDVTNGTGKNETGQDMFSPDAACTRAQAVTFLWRAAGSPEPASANNPFTDVSEGEYYYKAVLWAVEQGITKGISETEFSPNATCNRAQIVTFLHRYEGEPVASGAGFNDVPAGAYYYAPVIWAVSRGVTNGTGDGNFSPMDNCTRGQIVTFLYRDMVS